MSARLILPAGADVTDRETWLAERRKGVTASEIAAILGISSFQSPFNLFWEKTGAIPGEPDNDRLSLGRHLEPWIADRFAAAHPEIDIARGGLFQSVERPWQLATPDYLLDVPDEDGKYTDSVLEIKTSGTYDEWGDDGTDEIPPYIRAQVLWQEDTLDARVGYVSCLFLATQKIRTYEIPYDADDVAVMREHALAFLIRLKAGEAPPLDAHTATTAALRALFPDVDDDEQVTIPADVADAYRAAKAAAAAVREQEKAAENALRAAMGGAKVALDPDGNRVASRSVYERKPYSVGPARIDKLNPARKDPAA